MKKTIIVLFILFSSGVLFSQAMKFAADKPFNCDEYGEFSDVLKQDAADLLKHGAYGTPSNSPLHYVIQSIVVKHILQNEFKNGYGWNWRVSLRFFPAIALTVCTLIAAFLMLPISPIIAAFIPIGVSLSNFVLYYGGEARTYSLWFSLNLVFFIISFRFSLEPQRKVWIALWLLIVCLLCMTMVTSPAIIGLTAAAIFLSTDKVQRKRLISYLLLGIIFSIFLYFKYKHSGAIWNKSISERSLQEQLQTFWDHSLMPLGGGVKAIRSLLLMSIFMIAGLKLKNLTHRKLYVNFALLGFAFFGAVCSITAIQLLLSYFVLGRHVIFGAVISIITLGLTVLFLSDIIHNYAFTKWTFFDSSAKRRNASILILIIIFSYDWAMWNVVPLPKIYKQLHSLHTPYCHDKIWVKTHDDLAKDEQWEQRIAELHFNELNEGRHSNMCNIKGDTPGSFWNPPFEHIYNH